MGNRAWVTHIQYECAVQLAHRGGSADTHRLGDVLRACPAGANAIGMTRAAEQARALADRTGVAVE